MLDFRESDKMIEISRKMDKSNITGLVVIFPSIFNNFFRIKYPSRVDMLLNHVTQHKRNSQNLIIIKIVYVYVYKSSVVVFVVAAVAAAAAAAFLRTGISKFEKHVDA